MVNNLDRVYAALADATRRSIVEQLKAGDRTVSELGTSRPMTLAAVGKHLAVLESAGIVATRKTGRVRTCSLTSAGLGDASAWLARQEAFWHDRVDALITHLEENP